MFHRWKVILSGAPLFIAGMLLSIALCVFAYFYGDFPDRAGTVIYPLEYLSDGWRARLACIIIPGFMLLSCVAVLKNVGQRSFDWALPILALANLLACAASVVGSARDTFHIASLKQDEVVYHAVLEYRTFFDDDDIEAVIYECDSIGLICHTLHRVYLGPAGPRSELIPLPARLTVDDFTHTLALEVNGEIVYTHAIPETASP